MQNVTARAGWKGPISRASLIFGHREAKRRRRRGGAGQGKSARAAASSIQRLRPAAVPKSGTSTPLMPSSFFSSTGLPVCVSWAFHV